MLSFDEKIQLAHNLIENLNIPIKSEHDVYKNMYNGLEYILTEDLYDILTDKIKLKELIFKLNNKAFL